MPEELTRLPDEAVWQATRALSAGKTLTSLLKRNPDWVHSHFLLFGKDWLDSQHWDYRTQEMSGNISICVQGFGSQEKFCSMNTKTDLVCFRQTKGWTGCFLRAIWSTIIWSAGFLVTVEGLRAKRLQNKECTPGQMSSHPTPALVSVCFTVTQKLWVARISFSLTHCRIRKCLQTVTLNFPWLNFPLLLLHYVLCIVPAPSLLVLGFMTLWVL